MIAEAIAKIIEIHKPVDPTFVDESGIERHTSSGNILKKPSLEGTFGHSLDSVVEVVSKLKEPVVLQCSFEEVVIRDTEEYNECTKERKIHVAMPIRVREFPFGQPIDTEMFIIRASDFFERDGNFKAMISALSCITDVSETITSDDGMTQTVTFKSGINRKESAKIEPFVTLRAYRTFREVEQPQETYLMRLTRGKEGPLVALHEASGYMWKQTCSKSVYEYIRSRVDNKHMVIW